MCIKSCPSGALGDDFDCENCLSAITQKKGELTEWEESLIRKNKIVFGCDICQKVCPHNKDVATTPIDEFSKNRIFSISLEDIQNLTNREFNQKYGNRAFAWRGKAVLERNLKIIENE